MKIKTNTILLIGGAALVAWYLLGRKKSPKAVETTSTEGPVIKPETTSEKWEGADTSSGGSQVETGETFAPGTTTKAPPQPSQTSQVESSTSSETASADTLPPQKGDVFSPYNPVGRVFIGG